MAKQQFPWLQSQETKTKQVNGVRITYKELSYGDERKIQSECVSIGDNGKPQIDMGLMGTSRVVASLIDWDLTDENGVKLPIELNTFDNILNNQWATDIVEAVLGEEKKVSTKRKK